MIHTLVAIIEIPSPLPCLSPDHRATFSDSFVPGDLAAGSLLSSGVKEEPEVVTEDLPSHTDQLTGSDRVRRMMDIFHAGLEENKREKGRQGKKASRDTNIKSVQPPEKVPKRCVCVCD